ncbi:MAG: DedA family protein [Phycisphaerales bacterium]|jgi:membrane protein DedA with SNARE-associated domain|nr:DedA family protein [Phycisphaerales bacterium]
MEAWVDQILSVVDPVWGPWVVYGLLLLSGFGIPLGEDIIIIPAGMLVQHGELPLVPTLIAAYFGVVCGDILWFIVCSKLGTRMLHKKWFKRLVHPRRMLQVKYQFDVRGAWVVVLARFIPASRTTTITVAGMMHMSFWKFAAATSICVLVTAPMQLFAGWWIVTSLQAESTVEMVIRLLGLVMVVIAIILTYRLWSKHRRSGQRIPRAKVSWLTKFSPKK